MTALLLAERLVLLLPRRNCQRLLLFCTCRPLCVGAMWPMPAWVWCDVPFVFIGVFDPLRSAATSCRGLPPNPPNALHLGQDFHLPSPAHCFHPQALADPHGAHRSSAGGTPAALPLPNSGAVADPFFTSLPPSAAHRRRPFQQSPFFHAACLWRGQLAPVHTEAYRDHAPHELRRLGCRTQSRAWRPACPRSSSSCTRPRRP